MSPAKEQVIDMIRDLPDDVTLDEIIAEIYFKAQVDVGLRELDQGKGIPHEAVEERLSKWLTDYLVASCGCAPGGDVRAY